METTTNSLRYPIFFSFSFKKYLKIHISFKITDTNQFQKSVSTVGNILQYDIKTSASFKYLSNWSIKGR